MNVLLLSTCDATQRWMRAGLESIASTLEINCCDSLDFGLRVLEIHDDVNMIVVDTNLAGIDAPAAIKLLWHSCRAAAVVATASAPSAAEMVSCVNAGVLGYVPRSLKCEDLARVLSHISEGGYWMPDLRRDRSA